MIRYLAPATAAITPMSAGANTKKSDSVKLKGTTYGTQAGEEQAATISDPEGLAVRTVCPLAAVAVASEMA
ncbi:MAG: hypothetical protein M0P75_02960 [Candidatus Marinimicrobia bacterium]|nr:hypothetical protein [Candidatus Neomarinimicrobiota bacterium]